MWAVPPIFAGHTVAIFGTGPSLKQVMCDEVSHLPCVCVNDAFRMAPWGDVLYAADVEWWQRNPDAYNFDGLKVTCMASMKDKRVNVLQQGGLEGFDPRLTHIKTGGNSGYQAIHFAIHAKAKRILLYGFDMHGDHFFGKHKPPLRNTAAEHYDGWIARFPALMGRGSEIINCTPGSALKCFPFHG
jgi:hypothetical protein